jgi:NTE family protein
MADDEAAVAKPACILVLQGGGAMAAYHGGALEALQQASFEPDWVCGISMGAINGAIIAGNPPDRWIKRLDAFWETISRPSFAPSYGAVPVRRWEHMLSVGGALTLGQPGFFTPRAISPYFAPPGVAATSFYDTSPLYRTLAEFVDFDRLAQPGTRLSVGATNVETGELEFFDTRRMQGRFGPEHVVASGSLPPGFPATVIEGKRYWDGGCISNSPLKAVLDDRPTDLWSARGPAPDTMQAVEWRAKEIRYASISPSHISLVAAKIKLREAQRLLGQADKDRPVGRLDIVHIIYHPDQDQIPSSDTEFSRGSIATRRMAGLADMRRALGERPWHREAEAGHLGCLIHRVTEAGVSTLGADGAF